MRLILHLRPHIVGIRLSRVPEVETTDRGGCRAARIGCRPAADARLMPNDLTQGGIARHSLPAVPLRPDGDYR